MALTESEQLRIACDLADRGIIQREHYQVWKRRKEGETFADIRIDYYVSSSRRHHPTVRALQKWARRVREAIQEHREGKRVFGVTVASGSKVRTAADNTPLMILPGSSWDTERLRVVGVLDRYSKKR